ncbi:hypothetical protein O6H91_08G027500 [Diphasiastrum complanatum]|uniref:Uncharacterized protein n=1 Tax=Diphasiastrum complanatum TaxID=34168 RepID=A0ACC2CW89_DIPCM|nr:hypothetical protein O6H91_08G027500 [Diphasiastrum complanatum]
MGSLLGGGLREKSERKGQRDRAFLLWLRFTLFRSNGSNQIKLFLGFLLLLAMILLTSRATSLMGWSHANQEPRLPATRSRYTVVINTWKRNDLLKQSVEHYASCPSVEGIRVVWSETDSPPEFLRSTLMRGAHSNSRREVDLKFDIYDEDDLNNRFKPVDGLQTDAIFSIDDDVVVPCPTLEFAFRIWISAPDTMVGFVPRMHWVNFKFSYSYGGWWSVWWMGTYSMILTKAAFFHRKYLELYTYGMPASIRSFVKSQRNCEDIAMSFLVANSTFAPPIWVKGRIQDLGSSGISSQQGHKQHRTHCINYFASLFGYMPLISSHVKAVDAQYEWFW